MGGPANKGYLIWGVLIRRVLLFRVAPCCRNVSCTRLNAMKHHSGTLDSREDRSTKNPNNVRLSRLRNVLVILRRLQHDFKLLIWADSFVRVQQKLLLPRIPGWRNVGHLRPAFLTLRHQRRSASQPPQRYLVQQMQAFWSGICTSVFSCSEV